MKKKVYIVGNATHYSSFIDEVELVDDMKDADIVLFTGGADVDPSLYDDIKHETTFSYLERDLYEKEQFSKALSKGKFMLGICRGSQLLCALSGGKLIQDVNNHAGVKHDIRFSDGDVKKITSTHHQMMYPYNLDKKDYKLIAWSDVTLGTHHKLGNDTDVKKFLSNKTQSICTICGKSVPFGGESRHNCFKEPEIVYYNKTHALGIQGHPEMMRKDDSVVIKINEIIDKYVKN